MSLGRRLISTGAEAACLTETTDIFGDSSGVALYSLDYDASTAPDASTDYSGTPTDVDFGVGGQINYGARFNGSSSGVSISATATTPIDYASRVYSISFWINLPSIGNIEQVITKYGVSDSNRAASILIHTDGTVRLLERTTVSNSRYSTSALSANTWHHVVVSRSTTGVSFFIDGELKVSGDAQTYDFTPNNGGTEPIRFGRNNSGTPSYGEIDLDQVRFFNSTLTEANAATLYAEEACVHTATTTDNDFPTTNLAYYKLDNSAEDEKGSYDGTETDIEYRFGRYGQAAVFNGSSSYISSSNILDTSSAFSYSLWVKPNTIATYDYLIGHQQVGSPYAGVGLIGTASNTFSIALAGSAPQAMTPSLTLGNWSHLVLTHDGSGNYTCYTNDNGSPITYSGATSNNSSNPFRLGFSSVSGWGYYDGKIDQVRIFSTALTSAQVSQLYNEKPETDTSNFKTVLYEGNGGSQYISNVGFQPDLVWMKNRDSAYNHQILDSVRGEGIASNSKSLVSNNTEVEGWSSSIFGYLSSFDANGFTLTEGSTSSDQNNRNGDSYVAWVWKGGGDDVLNEEGTIDSQVSANTEAGFSIVKFDGYQSSGATVGHGLDNPPELIIAKNLDQTTSWPVFFDDAITMTSTTFTLEGSTKFLALNSTTSYISYTFDRQFGGTLNGGSGDEMIAYCFHSVSGYSRISTYEGSGSTQSIYVTDDGTSTGSGGFQPSFVMIKNIDATANWMMYDAVRDSDGTINLYLEANTSDAEASASTASVSPISNGFTIGNTSSIHINDSTDTYIYMAFK